ncbi:MAG: AraC family transcriptional regulator [Spirochaetaceae bacterium]|nr:AraC family transcriptional regulator [Spirochaetaceae bacterium]MDT8297626.1 AraC family transcriptional regulator [Spirochaetaceae bacterium]
MSGPPDPVGNSDRLTYDLKDAQEVRLPISPELGEGYADICELRNGLGFGSLKIKKAAEPRILHVRADPGRLKLTLHISRHVTRFGIDGLPEVLDVRQGDGYFLSVPANGIVHIRQDEELHEFSLMISEKMLCSIMDELPLSHLSRISNLVFHPAFGPGYVEVPSGRLTRCAASQLLNSPIQGPLRGLYLETKLRELLVLRLCDMDRNAGGEPGRIVLTPCDFRRVEEAREILFSEMTRPPGIGELARRVGLNSTKLKTGFRRRYGQAPFGYLREIRMSRAFDLLMEGEQNVSQVALDVGYSSFSAFSKAFKHHHGCLPGAVRRGGFEIPYEP